MQVGRVIVRVLDVLVTMPMRVLAGDRRIVSVRVVPVVVAVRMLVVDRFVDVRVGVALGRM